MTRGRWKSVFSLLFFTLLGVLLLDVVPAEAATSDMAGTWDSITLSGGFGALSPLLHNLRWQILDQARWRDDDGDPGFRFSENLLFGQVGYQTSAHTSLWGGYAHDWIQPHGKDSFGENRPYEDFLWNPTVGRARFTSRTRLEERIREGDGDLGLRLRQLFQVSYPLPVVEDLSAYVGDEVLGYLDENSFGRQGFSENRTMAGLSYQFTKEVGLDVGYLGQYVDTKSGDNLYTHNLQTNLRVQF